MSPRCGWTGCVLPATTHVTITWPDVPDLVDQRHYCDEHVELDRFTARFGTAVRTYTPLAKPKRTRLPVTVRKVGGWWTWYCNHLSCLDNLGGFRTAGHAADHGRVHLALWHDTDIARPRRAA